MVGKRHAAAGPGGEVNVTNLDECFRWQATVSHEFFGVAEGDHVIGPAVEDR